MKNKFANLIAVTAWLVAGAASGEPEHPASTPIPPPPGAIIASDYPNLQAAIDAVPYPGGVVYLPNGTYTLDKPLNLTNLYNVGQRTRWLVLQGQHTFTSVITGDFPDGPVIDMTGSSRLRFRDLTIAGNSKQLLLSARINYGGGGGNLFENVIFRGDHCEVAVALHGSECNRFYNCEIYVNQTNAIGVVFSPNTEFNVNGVDYVSHSPYQADITGGSNTELRFYGSFIHSFGLNSIGLFVQGSAADVSIHGGYNANGGFASIYLDGTKGNVGDIHISGLRIEGESGLYNLYAKGSVRNVSIEGGNFGSAGEVIRYEDVPDKFYEKSSAEGWSIRHLSLTLQDQSVRHPQKTGARLTTPRDERAVIRLDRAVNCTIENVWQRSYQIVPDGPQPEVVHADDDTIIRNEPIPAKDRLEWYEAKLLVVDGFAHGNTITTDRRDRVVLPEDSRGNRIVTSNDEGSARTYLGAGGAPQILNLTPVDLTTIKAPKLGDLVLASQLNGQPPRLALFDGVAWKILESRGE